MILRSVWGVPHAEQLAHLRQKHAAKQRFVVRRYRQRNRLEKGTHYRWAKRRHPDAAFGHPAEELEDLLACATVEI
jgi:hypothetical protein